MGQFWEFCKKYLCILCLIECFGARVPVECPSGEDCDSY